MAESPWPALRKSGRDLGASREEAGKEVIWGRDRSPQMPAGEALASPFCLGQWSPLLPQEAAVGGGMFSVTNDSCLEQGGDGAARGKRIP